MAYTYGDAGIKKYRYNAYIRTAAEYTPPTTVAEVTTLLGTGTKIGKLEDKSLKVNVKPNEKIDLNDGSKKVLDYIGTVEMTDLNNVPANINEITSTYDNTYVDIICDDPVSKRFEIVKNVCLDVEENTISGDKSSVILKAEKTVEDKDSFREWCDYSAFV